MKMLKRAITLTLLTGVLSGCGERNYDSTTSASTSSIVSYQFAATIDSYSSTHAPFPAAVGDVITGTFAYDPFAVTQKAPAGVQVKIGSVVLNSDLNNFNPPVVIFNDIQHPPNSMERHHLIMMNLCGRPMTHKRRHTMTSV